VAVIVFYWIGYDKSQRLLLLLLLLRGVELVRKIKRKNDAVRAGARLRIFTVARSLDQSIVRALIGFFGFSGAAANGRCG